MSEYCYVVQLEPGEPSVTFSSPGEVFTFLKKKRFITILQYNDKKTGEAYAKEAAAHELTAEEQVKTPIFAITALSDEGVFVESETFWIENYMFDEFYNPERMPYIEKVICYCTDTRKENEIE